MAEGDDEAAIVAAVFKVTEWASKYIGPQADVERPLVL
jgi:hypothetical protein